MKIKVGVLLSGSGSNFQALVDACKDENYPAEIVCVGCNKLDAYGIQRAIKEDISNFIFHHNKKKALENFIHSYFTDYDVELICLAGFMKILSANFIEKWDGKILNIHPSLLPSFKGTNAQKQAFEYGVKYSGCTLHWVVPEMDAGPIIEQRTCPIFDYDTLETFSERLLSEEHKLYSEVLNRVATKMLKDR